MEKPDYSNRCYKTKDDKRHSTIWGTNNLQNETPKEREERLKTIRENRGTWVWDGKKLVRKEDYVERQLGINAPQVSKWDPEWSVVSTGRRMSKGELKAYCKALGKTWENG